ncbi:MAG TPA: PBS lyase, partial [Anaeromyxobacteraceae bacterium]
VRRAAALATARWSGEAVDTSAPEAERRRAARRISEKLLEVGGEALRSAVTKVRVAPAPSPRPSPPVGERERKTAVPAARPRPRVTSPSPFQGEGRSAVAVAAADPSLAEAALTEVQAALRGRTADELSAVLGSERPAVESTLRALVAQGRLVARGPRFFLS